MHYSGVLVRALPADFERCAARIEALKGVELHYSYPASSSMVAVLETESLAEQESALRAVQDIPGVAAADLVYHHFEDATDLGEEASS